MPKAKMSKPRWLKILVLTVCLGLDLWLFWYSEHGGAKHSGLLTGLTLAMLSALFNTGYIDLPAGYNVPFLNVWPKLSDIAKAAVAFGLIFIWSPIALKLVPDTDLGMLIVLAPDVIFVFFALLFISNGLSKSWKQPRL
jgi:hypothetical protein